MNFGSYYVSKGIQFNGYTNLFPCYFSPDISKGGCRENGIAHLFPILKQPIYFLGIILSLIAAL